MWDGWACIFSHKIFMSGVIFETEIRMFASKDCCEMHDLCFFIVRSCENAVSQYVDAKGIYISKAAF
jgi:hypothetical protein